MFSTVFAVVAVGLIANVLLVLSCLPLIGLLMLTDPASSWPYLAALAPLCAPAIVGAFHVFAEHERGGRGPLRAFVSGWRRSWLKASGVGVLGTLALVVLLVDVRALSALEVGVLVIPLLAVLVVLSVGATLLALAGLAEVPTARVRDLLRASIYFAVRRWYLTAASLVVLVAQVALFTHAPALALGLTAAPALYLVWANSRFVLRPVLDDVAVHTVARA
ncbi:ferredoxin-NADPH reductase (plasmid) [Coraliomargarita sp. W4R53]